jgi:pimeloyl-ACP methyl ester carboxylesterase
LPLVVDAERQRPENASLVIGPAAMPSEFLCRHGGRHLYGESLGSGAPLIFCHGNPGNCRVWGDLPRALAPRFRVIVYDRYGCDRSGKPAFDGLAVLQRHSEDLRAIIDEVGNGRAHVVGWSVGGAIAQLTAAKYPDKVAGLVLLAPLGPTYRSPRPDVLERCARHPLGFRLIMAGLSMSLLRRKLVRRGLVDVFAPQPVSDDWVEVFARLYGDADTVRTVVHENASLAPETLSDLRPISRALILHGDGDRVVPLEVSEHLASIGPSATFIKIPGHGHAVHLTASRFVADEIRQFLISSAW